MDLCGATCEDYITSPTCSNEEACKAACEQGFDGVMSGCCHFDSSTQICSFAEASSSIAGSTPSTDYATYCTPDVASDSWPNEGSEGGSATFSGSGYVSEETVDIGYGAEAEVAALRGGTTAIIDFGSVIQTEFTICSVTRYSGVSGGCAGVARACLPLRDPRQNGFRET